MWISIEGNIGAGKTTLLNKLKDYFHDAIDFIPENVDEWVNYNGVNMLEAYYKDRKKYAFPLQSFLLCSLLKSYKKTNSKYIRITERCCLSNLLFISKNVKDGDLDNIEYTSLLYTYDHLVNDIKPDIIVYLRSDPETCLKNIKERGRPEEKDIPIDYLKDLHDLHDEWLPINNISDTKYNIPVVHINNDNDFECIVAIMESVMKYKNKFI